MKGNVSDAKMGINKINKQKPGKGKVFIVVSIANAFFTKDAISINYYQISNNRGDTFLL